MLDHRHPPAPALEWAARAVGDGARVVHVRALPGGSSSALHALTIEDGRGTRTQVVLRRYVAPEVLEEDPDLVPFEARVLRHLARSEVLAPHLVAMDAHARFTDVPALLMTALPGRIDLAPRDLDRHVERLAAALALVHALRPMQGIPPYARYNAPGEDAVPAWSREPDAWRALVDGVSQPAPASHATFIHRDYHPANVLWSRGRVSGIVDWVNASIGAPEVDVGHCRWNLAALHGIEVADAFLDAWMRVTGTRDYDPYYDAATLLDSGVARHVDARDLEPWRAAGRTDLTPRTVRSRLDAYAVSLARRLSA